jgi:hypothetical protein
MKTARRLVLALLPFALAACGGESRPERPVPVADGGSVSTAILRRLLDARVYFAHQSVGSTIIEGIRDLYAEGGVGGLEVVDMHEGPVGTAPAFYHAALGRNGDPLGKLAAFQETMAGESGDSVDVALMKFCYVDIVEGSDVQRIFSAYAAALDALQGSHPGTAFVAVTVPLTAPERGLGAIARQLLAVTGQGYRDNRAREEFNGLVRARFRAPGGLFDLAEIESTRPDGSRVTLDVRGTTCFALDAEYTNDGGHLNKEGRKRAAAGLLRVLSEALDRERN